ncbi:MAG: hypothetical protein LBC50_00945 [Candidatus Ancillula sp.]|jgi:aspartate carbamoyltransferase catalytic subunit|nr:hypothetical protein [Candidatus Ancillula sp.]
MKHLLSIAELEPAEIVSILSRALHFKDVEESGANDSAKRILAKGVSAFEDVHVLIVGDILHSRVARSNLQLITKLGGRVTFVAPPTLLPSSLDSLPDVNIEYDFDKALAKGDFQAIMLLRIQAERMLGGASGPDGSKNAGFFPTMEEYIKGYGLTNERITKVDPTIPVLHPAPINRGLEISSEIADSKQSLINHQIRNGVFTRMSCLDLLVNHSGAQNVPQTLKGKTIVNLFFENSTRTRFSFEAAEKRLGAGIINFSTSGSSVAKGESLKDTVTTLYAMGIDGIVVRHQDSGAAYRLANSDWVDVPVLNAGDGTHAHPTQALLDAMTLCEHLAGVSAIHGTTDSYGRRV